MNRETEKQTRMKGFSLLEVMISLSVFSIAAAGYLPVFNSFMGKNSNSHVKVNALQAAEQVLDLIRVMSTSSLPSSGDDGGQIVQVGKNSFNVVTYYCEQASLCTGSSTRHIRVNVRRNNEEILNIQTVFTALK